MRSATVTGLDRELDALLAADPRAVVSDLAKLQEVEDLLTASNRLDAVIAHRLQVLNTDNVTVAEVGKRPRSWLIEDEARSEIDAGRRMTVARALPEHPVIETALAAGDISLEHAHVILRLLRSTPVELRDVVEKELVTASEHADPTSLGRLCRELKDRFGGNEDRDAADARRFDNRWLTMSTTIDGMTSISGMLDPAGAATVKAALRAGMHKGGTEDTRSVAQRRADALVSLATQALNSGGLPDVAGDRPHVNLTLGWEDLKRDLDQHEAQLAGGFARGAMLDGTEISISTARMLACDAGIIPVVLGGKGEILDLGRKTPTWSAAQRRALLIETDNHCGWPGQPGRSTGCRGSADHAHHIHHWAKLGPTDIKNGVYLCWFHHWLIHNSNWNIHKAPDGTLAVHRT